MKSSSIKKINVAGTVGYVISILLIVCSIASMVMVGIGCAAAVAVSKDEISVKIHSDIDINSTGNFLDMLNKFVYVGGVDNIGDLLTEDGKEIEVNDKDISGISVAENAEGGLSVGVKTNEITFSIKRIVAALILSFVFLGAVTVALEMLKRLMKSLKSCETPFSQEIVSRMSRFAYSLIPVAVLNTVCSGIWPTVSHGAEYDFTLNLGVIMLVAIIYLLVLVFRHGAQLQRESDETL